MRHIRGLGAPAVFGEPDDLAGTRSRRTEPCDEDTDSRILSEAAGSGIQGGDVASGEGRRSGRSLAAEGATAHVCAAVHNTPPQMLLAPPITAGTLASIRMADRGVKAALADF